jgi:hypothetical protein
VNVRLNGIESGSLGAGVTRWTSNEEGTVEGPRWTRWLDRSPASEQVNVRSNGTWCQQIGKVFFFLAWPGPAFGPLTLSPGRG